MEMRFNFKAALILSDIAITDAVASGIMLQAALRER
jgi:hypothetical protein